MWLSKHSLSMPSLVQVGFGRSRRHSTAPCRNRWECCTGMGKKAEGRKTNNIHCQSSPELTQWLSGLGNRESRAGANSPDSLGKTQRYPRAPQLWHVNLGVPGSLWPRKREWQQHFLAVPAQALSAWSPPCLLWTEGAVEGEQRILINGLHHTLFSLKIPPWNREGQNTHLS